MSQEHDRQLQSLIQRSERINADSQNLITEVIGIIGGYLTAQERNATDLRQRLTMLGQPRPSYPNGPAVGPGDWRQAAARVPTQ